MRTFVHCILALLLLLGLSFGFVKAGYDEYMTDDLKIIKLKQGANFKVLTPEAIPHDWEANILTFSENQSEGVTSFRIHYMNKSDGKVMFILTEQKDNAVNNIGSKTMKGEIVHVNGHKGRYLKWGSSGKVSNGAVIQGGLLRWKQEGTMIEIDSAVLSKDEILNIARSMR